MNDMNFMSSTNNFQFDPQLFGGYREPQENILGTGLDDTFFNDAFDVDFTTPYFAPSPAQKKDDLMSRIDAAKNDDATELVQTTDGQLLTCNKIWYVDSRDLPALALQYLTMPTGRNCRAVRRSRTAISTWMVCVLTSRRRPSVLAPVQSSTSRPSRR